MLKVDIKRNALLALSAPVGYFTGGIVTNKLAYSDVYWAVIIYGVAWLMFCGLDFAAILARRMIHGTDA